MISKHIIFLLSDGELLSSWKEVFYHNVDWACFFLFLGVVRGIVTAILEMSPFSLNSRFKGLSRLTNLIHTYQAFGTLEDKKFYNQNIYENKGLRKYGVLEMNDSRRSKCDITTDHYVHSDSDSEDSNPTQKSYLRTVARPADYSKTRFNPNMNSRYMKDPNAKVRAEVLNCTVDLAKESPTGMWPNFYNSINNTHYPIILHSHLPSGRIPPQLMSIAQIVNDLNYGLDELHIMLKDRSLSTGLVTEREYFFLKEKYKLVLKEYEDRLLLLNSWRNVRNGVGEQVREAEKKLEHLIQIERDWENIYRFHHKDLEKNFTVFHEGINRWICRPRLMMDVNEQSEGWRGTTLLTRFNTYKGQALYTIDKYRIATMFDFTGNPYEGPMLDKITFLSRIKLDSFFKLSFLIDEQRKDIKSLFEAQQARTPEREVESTFIRFKNRGLIINSLLEKEQMYYYNGNLLGAKDTRLSIPVKVDLSSQSVRGIPRIINNNPSSSSNNPSSSSNNKRKR